MTSKRVFIIADHGLAIFYFLQSDVLPTLLDRGVKVVLLTDDKSVDQIRKRFNFPGLTIEGLHLDRVDDYVANTQPMVQWWLDFLRRAGAAGGTNLAAVEIYIQQVKSEAHSRRKRIFPIMESLVKVLRHSRLARRSLVRFQNHFTPSFYDELFNEYQPDLVIASSPGFRKDRYILRAATKHNTPTAAAIFSWDSSSSYGLSGAEVDWITCWSEIQKGELIGGADWSPEKVNVGGMPPYDGYVRKQWVMERGEYFNIHGLDPNRKLLSYASSFVNLSPNIQNIQALVNLVNSDRLNAPSQLLIRLHPIHMSGHFVEEADQIRQIAKEQPHVHVVEPKQLGELDYYSVDDLIDKTSMMAHADIFLTVYSTMCVEASFQERPIISVCIDSNTGYPGKYWLPMSKIGIWPTHSRFRASGAGRVATNETELCTAINDYYTFPQAHLLAQKEFVNQECTYTDGSSGRRTGEFLLSLLEKSNGS
jgi:CDP-glycerol glycerophosphotransferase (TagB/SpsB family)